MTDGKIGAAKHYPLYEYPLYPFTLEPLGEYNARFMYNPDNFLRS